MTENVIEYKNLLYIQSFPGRGNPLIVHWKTQYLQNRKCQMINFKFNKNCQEKGLNVLEKLRTYGEI